MQAALADIEEEGKLDKINSLIAEYKKNGAISDADAKKLKLSFLVLIRFRISVLLISLRKLMDLLNGLRVRFLFSIFKYLKGTARFKRNERFFVYLCAYISVLLVSFARSILLFLYICVYLCYFAVFICVRACVFACVRAAVVLHSTWRATCGSLYTSELCSHVVNL